ncbi:MAG: TetR/AcrR family transcriptional regulator [Sphingomonadales bacterium]|nr:MAG: TetR/AcrR family transcriptional regulator [Sphingomonadales bacterium]
MRVRTDEKRQEIMSAAAAVFGETGYERSSMAAIAQRANASKQTLYSYFESKEDMFSAVMLEAMETQAIALFALLDVEVADMRTTLEVFGAAYIDFVTSADAVSLTRVAVTIGGQGGLGPRLYAHGPKRGWEALAANLERWGREGKLHIEDSRIAALHLKGLLEAGLVEPQLFGAEDDIPRSAAANHAVRVFLEGYAVRKASPAA